MKHLKLLESWANGVITEKFSNNQSPARMGTPMKKGADRPLSRQVDIAYKAQRAHPELSPEQALALYMSDELVDKEKMDLAQNKLINRVKGENDKLTRTVTELGKELHDFEQHSAQTDQEVSRLKDLSAKLRPAGELQQQTVRASQEQVQKMLNDLEQVKHKPGISEKEVNELKAQIDKARTGASSNQIKQLELLLSKASQEHRIEKDQLHAELQKVKATDAARDARFSDYTAATKSNFEKYDKQFGAKFNELGKKFQEIEKNANEKLEQIDQASAAADETLNRISQMVRKMQPGASTPAITALSTLDDRDEAHQAMAAPSATTVPPIEAEPELEMQPKKQIPQGYDQYDISDLVNKYNRRPTNVKRSGNLSEQIEMYEPEDEVETIIIPKLIRRYGITFPDDLKKWSEDQLREIFRKTVDRGLLIWAPDIDEKRVKNYLIACHNWLRKTRPAIQPELPGMPEEPPIKPVQESVFKEFTDSVTKLSGGY